MKKLLVTALLFLASCSSVGIHGKPTPSPQSVTEVISPTLTVTLTPTRLMETSTPAPTPTKDVFVHRNFSDDWAPIYPGTYDCIDFDSRGRMWALSSNRDRTMNLEYLNEEAWVNVPIPSVLNGQLLCPRARNHRSVWFFNIAEAAPNMMRFDEKKWAIFEYPDFPNTYTSAEVDAFGNVWLGLQYCRHAHSCLYRFDGKKWREEKFPFKTIFSLSADAHGNLWVGGDELSGVAHYDGKHWTFYDYETLWPNIGHGQGVYGIAVTANSGGFAWVFLSGRDWVRITKDGRWERYSVPIPLYDRLIEDGQKRVWFVFDPARLGYFDYGKSELVMYDEVPSDGMAAGPAFHLSPNGDLWFILPYGSSGKTGIYKYLRKE